MGVPDRRDTNRTVVVGFLASFGFGFSAVFGVIALTVGSLPYGAFFGLMMLVCIVLFVVDLSFRGVERHRRYRRNDDGDPGSQGEWYVDLYRRTARSKAALALLDDRDESADDPSLPFGEVTRWRITDPDDGEVIYSGDLDVLLGSVEWGCEVVPAGRIDAWGTDDRGRR